MKRSILALAAALAGSILFSTACSTKIVGLRRDPSFTYPAILQGKMAVGGVASAAGEIKAGERSNCANLLRTQILEIRPSFGVLGAGEVATRLGASEYEKMMEEYRTIGAVGDASLQAMKKKVKGAQYIVFARIETDLVSNDRSETSETTSGGVTTPGRVTTTSERSMLVSMAIYDLQSGGEVWGGNVEKFARNTQTYDKDLQIISLVKAVVKTEAEKYPYPDPPAPIGILAEAFRGFAENFPNEED